MKLYIQYTKDKRVKNPKKVEYDIPSCLTDQSCIEIEQAIDNQYYYNFYDSGPGNPMRKIDIDDYKSDILNEISKYRFKKEFNGGENTWMALHEMKKEIEELRDELASIKSTFRNAFGCKMNDY